MAKDLIEDMKENDFSLLIEAGFVAVKQLDEVSATRIFNAAQAISPKNSAPKVGLGYIALNKLELKEAVRIFEEVLAVEPTNYLAQTFLGICFILTKPKKKKGEKIIQDAMAKTDNPAIKNLGRVSLEWSEKDLKKGSAPFLAAKAPEDAE
jgi:Flp pilus assembly protein TadD